MVDLLVAASRVVAAAAGVGLLALGYRVWTRHERPAADTLVGLLVAVAGAALCTALVSHELVAYKLLWLYAFLGIPPAFALFSFDYYGLDFPVSRLPAWAAVTPLVVAAFGGTVLVLGTPAMVPGADAPVPALAELPAFAFGLAVATRDVGMYYAGGLMILAVGLVLRTVFRYDHLEAGLGVALSFVGVWPWLAYVISPELTGLVGFGGSLAAIAGCYAASFVAATLAYRSYGVLETTPAAGNAAPESVLNALADPVVVVDRKNRVLRLNESANEQFGVADDAVVGGTLAEELGIDDADLAGSGPVELETVDGKRRFELTTSTVLGRAADDRGRVILCRDVTRRETREQRLQVLNRIVRHNLRNDMNAILGYAGLIADGGRESDAAEEPAETADHADSIRRTARELVSLGERAREVETMMARPRRPDETTDVAAVVSRVVDEQREHHPDVEFATAVGGDVTARVDEHVLRTVLRNVVDNACRHNDAAEPLVVVNAERADGNLALAVTDNGPGLSEQELGPVEAGTESSLEHGSGLGLWAVKWGVRRMGGELAFGDNDPRGTVVRIDLPAAGASARPDAVEAAD